MKRIILISAFFAVAYGSYAQTCSKSDPIFNQDHAAAPKDVYSLGSNPEFPFLRNLSTPQQVADAMRKADSRRTPGANKLNALLTDIGFANGAKDVTASNISAFYVPDGTVGNMGDGNYTSHYTRLMSSDPNGTKAWKVTAPAGCELVFLSKCGNAFFQTSAPKTASAPCINAPLNFIGDSKEVTLTGGGQQTTTDNVYIYYHRKHKGSSNYASPEIPDPNPSRPLLLSTTSKTEAVAATYKISVSSPDGTGMVKVCPDQTLDVNTNINVEKVGSYTGFYPSSTKKEYRKVTKCAYRKAMKKMAKAQKKEAKIKEFTGVVVKN